MIEIIPHNDFCRGSYSVKPVIDKDVYLYINNELFIKDWNQYVKKMKVDSHFIKSKWFPEEEASSTSLSPENILAKARKFSEFTEYRRGKRGRHFQKLVDNFDRERSLIIYHNSKFYTYK